MNNSTYAKSSVDFSPQFVIMPMRVFLELLSMLISKFFDPKNDFAFKKVFGTEKNKDILIEFINDLIVFKDNVKIKSVEFLPSLLEPEARAKKTSVVDVLCKDDEGRLYVVEMQVASQKEFVKRAQYYAAKAYVSQAKEGDEYKKLQEVVFLAITDFVMFPKKSRYKSDHIILDREDGAHDLQDFSFTFLELPKFNKEISELSSRLEKWAYFFKHANHTSENDLPRIVGNDSIIQKAYEELNFLTWSEAERNTYESFLKADKDQRAIFEKKFDEGFGEGFDKGVNSEREKTNAALATLEAERAKIHAQRVQQVKLMHKRKMDPAEISTFTGCSLEQVETIISQEQLFFP